MSAYSDRLDKLTPKHRALFQLLLEKKKEGSKRRQIARRSGNSNRAPLSFPQQRLWFIDQLQPGLSVYNIPMGVRLTGPLDVAALKSSLNEIVRRHESLRTTFAVEDGQPAQVISPAFEFAFPVIDLSALPEEEREIKVRALADEDCQQPFDLTTGPLLRATLLKLGAKEHVVLFVMHHIISDDWSLGALTGELAALYDAFSNDRPSPLAELEIQYADFAVWQREFLEGEALNEQAAYWKQTLAHLPPVLELPTDRPRPPVQSMRGSVETLMLPANLCDALKGIGLQQDATLYMTLLAAFQTLLHRYTNQDDIVVGSPIANRTSVETEQLIGFFVNTLVLRTDLSGNPTFIELLARVREVMLGAYAHQDMPFEQLVEDLQPDRSLSHSPLFQALFVLQNAPRQQSLQDSALQMSALQGERGTSKFDLTLSMAETPEGLNAAIEYSTDLFDAATIKRMLAGFKSLLEGAASNPDARIWSLPMISPEDREWLVAQINDTRAVYSESQCIHQLFEAQAASATDKIAIESKDERLTYGELNSRANQLANYLRELGAGRETRVGLCLERSADMVVALLGILKAGGAYIPIDPTYPKERIEFVLQDSGMQVLVTQASLADELPCGDAAVVRIDADWDQIARCDQSNPKTETLSSNLAYVIYTSGSTGQPKGVQIEHKAVVNFLESMRRQPGIADDDVLFAVTSLSFDIAGLELFLPLIAGAQVVVASREETRDATLLTERLAKTGATVMQATPSTWRMIIESGWAGDPKLKALCGGEALPGKLAEEIAKKSHSLWNLYGPTETTIWSAVNEMTDHSEAIASIGGPIANTQIYLLDREMNVVSPGVAGDLVIGGEGLARGYSNRPDLTAEKFIPDPFSSTPGARLYATGDLARYRKDGKIEFLGRNDHQVKVRGFRIELGEIESALVKHPAVREAVVIAREDEPGDKQLVAYITAKSEQAPGVGELRSFLKDRLPEYFLPAIFITLEALPLTPNGKIDRRALPAPDRSRPDSHEPYRAPQTPVEEALAAVWANALRVDRVGIDDNYFALGGDSMRSIQMRSLAQSRGLDFSLQQLFQHQTIRELARQINFGDAAADGAIQTSAFGLISEADRQALPAEIEDAYPLTRLQAGMLFHSDFNIESSVYHNVSSFHLKAQFDDEAMRAAIRLLLSRHAVLRTSFDLSNFSEPLQIVHNDVEIPLAIEDLRQFSVEEKEQLVSEWLEAEKKKRFDWNRAPLVRFQVHRRSDDTFQFSLTHHHAILDGWSVASMLTELFQLYHAISNNQELALAEAPAPMMREYVALERQTLESEQARSFWAETLSDSSVAKLPRLPRDERAKTSFRVHKVDAEVSADTTEKLIELARAAAVPLKTVLMAAHIKVLSMMSGESDVVTGLVMNARPEISDGERALGLFLNTVPLRVKLNGGTWTDLVKQAFEAEMQTLPFRRYPMAELQKTNGGASMFEAAFNYTHFHVYEGVQDSHAVEVMGGDGVAETNFDWHANFDWNQSNHELRVSLHGNIAEFTEAQIETFSGYYAKALAEIANNPEARYDWACLISDEERERVLADPKDAGLQFDQDQCIHRAVEARVAQTPDAIAVTFEDQNLTYAELNREANRLAHYLISIGVEPGALVGVSVERSAEMIVSLLAVLKTGAAYVPIDATNPKERISFIVEDSRIPVLLVQQRLADQMPECPARIVCFDADREIISQQPDHNPDVISDPEHIAYVIYTSGSTGRPKGVLATHLNVSRLLTATHHWFRFDEKDVWALFHSYAFDFSVWEIWGALAYGGRLVVASYWVSRTPEAFYDLLVKEGATVLNQTPSAFRQLIKADEERKDEAAQLRLRVAVFGGEALEIASLKPWFERHDDKAPQLINMYGITETSVHSTYRPVTRADAEGEIPSMIGGPISDLRVYALDSRMNIAPVGVAGEIYVAGPGVTLGYHNRPDLTAERFVPDPFGGVPGQRLYKSGDLARYMPDGDMEYIGRIDHQVKIRGFRIELGEIEAALSAHPRIAEAVVAMREDQPGDHRLAAYIVGREQSVLTVNELREFLRERLPEHMVPAAFVQLEALPLTGNGKVNRRALPAPETARPELEQSYVAPITEQEKILAEVWAQTLGIERVGVHDNFFALGGDSIRSIQVRALAEKRGLHFSLQQLFHRQTIHDLAAELATDQGEQQGAASVGPFGLITEEDRLKLSDDLEDAYPLAMLQSGMLFHSQFNRESAMYHDIFTYHLRAPFDESAMRRAINQLISRHPVLRTSFDLSSFSEPLQLVHREIETPLFIEDLRHIETEEQDRIIDAWINVEKNRQFDLTRAPLLSFNAHRRDEESYQLTLSFHHVLMDGWSVASLLTELFRLYLSALGREGHEVSAPPALSYRHFVALERKALNSEESRRYWTEQLEDSPFTKLPRLPVPASEKQPRQYRMEPVQLPAEISEGLRQLAQMAGVPLKSVLLAAHLRVLSLVTGQTDMVTGIGSHGRPEDEDGDRILGLFLNSIPLRAQLNGGTWMELAQETFNRERELLEHRRYPLAQLQKISGKGSLFETGFNFLHFHIYESLIGFDEIEPLSARVIEDTNFIFTAQFSQELTTGVVRLRLDYDDEELNPEQMKAVGEYYARALASMAADPNARYEGVNLLSDEERDLLLHKWNHTEEAEPQEQSISRCFEIQVEQTPEALAVSGEQEQLTYAELNRRANKIANYLQSVGVGPEVRVALYLDNSLDVVLCMIAALKAGAAYAPIDPTYPAERAAFMLEDSQASIVITRERLLDQMPASWAQTICLDADESLIVSQSDANPICNAEADNLAYLIYTSGSTGTPKAVMATRGGLLNHARALINAQRLGSSDHALQYLSLSFDASIEEIMPCLLSGAELVLRGGVRQLTPAQLMRLCEERQISILHMPAAMWQQMVEDISSRGQTLPECLRVVLIGGDSASVETANLWSAISRGKVLLLNAYGPTEATITATIFATTDASDAIDCYGKLPIGKPIANARIYALDRSYEPSPIGVVGEVYIAGAGIARGYEGRADLTAERFLPDPFSAEAGARMYRTGDLGRRMRDGQLEYLGRVDEQVKVRGYRIEPAEVEAGLMSVEGVRQAAVVTVEDSAGGKRLMGFVVSDDGVEAQEVSGRLAERLPEYMRPSEVVKIERMPVTANGKVDRKALKAMSVEASAASRVAGAGERAQWQEPEGEMEQRIASVYEQALGREKVGATESFFGLGGDSIRSIRVVAMLAEQGIEVSVQEVFEHQSVRELAQAIISRQGVEIGAEESQQSESQQSRRVSAFEMLTEEDRAKIERLGEDVEDAYPLSQLQAGMVYHSELNPETAIYHSIMSYHLGGRLDLSALRSALDLMSSRHQMLRTSFDLSSYSEPLQLVHRQAEIPLQVEDISHLDERQQADLVERWIEAERHRHFQWKQPPLVRVHIHKRSETTFQFTLTAPHAIFDGWSDGLLLTELFQLYAASSSGERIEQAKLASSYRDYVWQEREELRRGDSRDFWAGQVEGLRPTRVWRAGRAQRDEAIDNGQAEAKFTTLQVEFGESCSQKLAETAKRLGVPLKSALLAAHLRVMQEVSGQAEVTTGVVSNGRLERRDGEKVIGLFLNTLPLRMRLEGGSWEELIREVFEAEKAMMKHRRYPLAQIQREAGGEELFETGFNYTHFHVYDQLRGNEELETIEARGVSETNFLMMASFDQSVGNGGVRMSLFINESEVGLSQGERIAEKYRRAVEAIAERAQQRYEQEELMSEQEKARIESRWAEAKRDRYSDAGSEAKRDEHVRDQHFEEAVSEHAHRSPDRVAIQCASGDITYGQLEERTNRLARLLISRGVGPETLVAVCLSRGEQMVEAILAALKAGAGYLPVDTSYPKSRIEYMLEDSAAQVVISERQQQQKLEGCKGEVIWMDEAEAEIAAYSAEPMQSRAEASNAAYVIYTSGTTGRPKGAVIERRAMSNLMRAQQQWLEVGEQEVVMQFSSWSFDASVWEMVMGLGSGGRLVIREKEGLMDVEELRQEMSRRGVTAVTLPPSVLRAMREEGLEGLRKVISAGEKWDRQIVEKWGRQGRRLVNAYGPTETAVCATMTRGPHSGDGEASRQGSVRSIGGEIRNVRVAIMDERMRMCGEGVEGEIWIGGEGVGRGYWNRAELTAEKFVPDATSEVGGERMYRSGDRGRWVGVEIEYEGRADEQVKVRGHRIEVGEIEEEMKRIEWVREAVVVARAEGGMGGGVELKGYVVIGEGWAAQQAATEQAAREASAEREAKEGEERGRDEEREEGIEAEERGIEIEREIKRRMRERLPEWMMVAEIEEIAEAPLTASGKIDREELKRRSERGRKRAKGVGRREARDEVEREMKRIWEEVMGEEEIGMEESFFEAGGHSLKATQIVTRVRERWGIELEMRGMFERPTIEGMSEMVRERAEQGERAAAEEEQIMKMLEGIESLSDDDVKRMIEANLLDTADA